MLEPSGSSKSVAQNCLIRAKSSASTRKSSIFGLLLDLLLVRWILIERLARSCVLLSFDLDTLSVDRWSSDLLILDLERSRSRSSISRVRLDDTSSRLWSRWFLLLRFDLARLPIRSWTRYSLFALRFSTSKSSFRPRRSSWVRSWACRTFSLSRLAPSWCWFLRLSRMFRWFRFTPVTVNLPKYGHVRGSGELAEIFRKSFREKRENSFRESLRLFH